MVYYLKIVDAIIKINCPDNLYLFDDWQRFFEDEWGKPFLISKTKSNFIVYLCGARTTGNKIIKGTLKDQIELPKIESNKLFFDNMLNTSLFVSFLKNLVTNYLESKKFLLLHASGFVKDEKAILVTGNSKSGKSTVLRQMINHYSPIGEDIVAIKKEDNKIWAYPTPFNIKIDSNLLVLKKFEVGKVLTVKKNEDFCIEKVETTDALILLIDQTRNIINNSKMAKMSFDYFRILSDNTYVLSYKLGDPLIDLIKNII